MSDRASDATEPEVARLPDGRSVCSLRRASGRQIQRGSTSADHIITVQTFARQAQQPSFTATWNAPSDSESELEEPLLPLDTALDPQLRRKLNTAFTLSWIVNILLLVSKIWAYLVSDSKAVLASAADSAVDLLSQVVISYTDWRMQKLDPHYPVGQARLEAIGVLICK
jgi:hypothetical protein